MEGLALGAGITAVLCCAMWLPMLLGWASAGSAEAAEHYEAAFPVLGLITAVSMAVVLGTTAYANWAARPDQDYGGSRRRCWR